MVELVLELLAPLLLERQYFTLLRNVHLSLHLVVVVVANVGNVLLDEAVFVNSFVLVHLTPHLTDQVVLKLSLVSVVLLHLFSSEVLYLQIRERGSQEHCAASD